MVKFNDPEEYVEELKKDAYAIERAIVRVTRELRSTQIGMVHVSVVATAIVNRHVVRLEVFCGQAWSGNREALAGDPLSLDTNTRADKVMTELEAELRAKVPDVQLRAGVYSEDAGELRTAGVGGHA